ncbi:MAG: sel1 repeat family protein, partial [Planctomycetaceae bacterium]|nr:sel1 repeat family protein [Planctomycetaceae bacterium]
MGGGLHEADSSNFAAKTVQCFNPSDSTNPINTPFVLFDKHSQAFSHIKSLVPKMQKIITTNETPEIMLARTAAYAEGKNSFAQNETKTVKWIRKAAEQGNAAAQVSLGKRYLEGSNVQKDEVEAVKWFRKAAEQGNAEGEWWLGTALFEGLGGLSKNTEEAVKWFRKAAEQCDDNWQCLLGIALFEGWGGLNKDEVEEVKWFRKAAEQGNA